MNRNILIAIVVILVIGGVVMVQNSSKTQTTNPGAQTQTPSEKDDSKMDKSETEPSASAMEDDEKNANEITLTSSGFSPATITIKAGEKVVWKNESGGPATVDSAQHPTHLVYPKLNLGRFEDGEELSLVFDEPGKYNYHDHLNASRFGTVVVE